MSLILSGEYDLLQDFLGFSQGKADMLRIYASKILLQVEAPQLALLIMGTLNVIAS